MLIYPWVLIFTAGISFLATPFAKKIAQRIGAIDIPKDDRRIHKKPIPRLGGLAIYIAIMIGSITFLDLNREIISILVGVSIIAVAGFIDDMKPVTPRMKLLFQIIAAGVLIYGGIRIDFLSNPFTESNYLSLGLFAIPATVFWVVGITNTVNLIDGLDGLSAGVSIISALSFAAIAYMMGNESMVLVSLIVAGSALGFLPYNFNPATIFMGDTGALVLGFMLAAISIEAAIKSAAAIAIVAPILSLGLPVLDTAFAILRRYKNNKPIMGADKGHLHHRLLELGLGQKRTVIILYIVSALFGICAIIITRLEFAGGIMFLLALFIVVVYFMFKLRELGRNNRNRKL